MRQILPSWTDSWAHQQDKQTKQAHQNRRQVSGGVVHCTWVRERWFGLGLGGREKVATGRKPHHACLQGETTLSAIYKAVHHPLLLTYLTTGLLLIVPFVPTSARRPLHTTCATTATSSDSGSRHAQPQLKQATPEQTQQRSSSDDQYVYFMGKSIFTDQFESYIQQVNFFFNLPDIGKGVKGSLCRHYRFW